MPTTVHFTELPALAGRDLGHSDWLTIDQKRIDTFADAAEDQQWIHTDPERAKDGPFGATIAHGYLTLALVIPLFAQLLEVDGVTTKINYGLGRVRFPSPVRVDSRVRLSARITDVTEVAGGGLQLTFDATVELEGEDKPACVAQAVFRFYA